MSRLYACDSGQFGYLAMLRNRPVRIGDTLRCQTNKLVRNINGKPLAKKELVTASAKVLELRFFQDPDNEQKFCWAAEVMMDTPVYEKDAVTQNGTISSIEVITEEERLWWANEFIQVL